MCPLLGLWKVDHTSSHCFPPSKRTPLLCASDRLVYMLHRGMGVQEKCTFLFEADFLKNDYTVIIISINLNSCHQILLNVKPSTFLTTGDHSTMVLFRCYLPFNDQNCNTDLLWYAIIKYHNIKCCKQSNLHTVNAMFLFKCTNITLHKLS